MIVRNFTTSLLSLSIAFYLSRNVSGFSPDFHFMHASLQHLPIFQNAVENMISHTTTTAISSTDIGNDVIGPAFDSYRQALREKPLETKVATGVVLAVVGDAIAQGREPAEYDTKRAAAFVAFDGCYRAVQQLTYPPLISACQGQHIAGMLALLGLQTPPSDTMTLMAALEQTIVSQFAIIPLIYYPVFYAVTGAVQGLTIDETVQRAKDTFIPLMKRNLAFWIPVQFGVFGFVEENLQIPILIVCGLVWTIILSISAGAVKAPTKEVINPLLEEEIILAMESESSSARPSGSFFNPPKAAGNGVKTARRSGNVAAFNATVAESNN